MTSNSRAFPMLEGELTPSNCPWKPAFRSASAKDPPIRPTPKMATLFIYATAAHAALDGPANSRSDHPELAHQFGKLRGTQGLRAIAQGMVGVRVNFHKQPIRARSHSGTSHR